MQCGGSVPCLAGSNRLDVDGGALRVDPVLEEHQHLLSRFGVGGLGLDSVRGAGTHLNGFMMLGVGNVECICPLERRASQ